MVEAATVGILYSVHNATDTIPTSPPPAAGSWHLIDWSKARRIVKNLQARIVKAVEAGNWKKVRSLQRLLTNSWSAKVLAILKVTRNKGGKTAGVDGKRWSSPKSKWEAIEQLQTRGYRVQPVKRIKIPKGNGKWRKLGIPTIKDRAMQALHLQALDPVAETLADGHSYGFRPRRSCADAIRQCFNILYRPQSAEWILEADIKACFDHISHQWLLNHIPMNKGVLKKWLTAGYMDRKQRFATTAGTPQGAVISPTLANMVLDGLQQTIDQHFGITRKKGYPNLRRIHFVRYADDFIVTAKDKADLISVQPVIEQFLAERGMELSQEKTKITHTSEGFDFLGKHIRKYKGKLLTQPSKKSIKKVLDKLQQKIHKHRASPTYLLIHELNPILRGWANYHRADASKRAFQYVGSRLWQMLWKWAKRRHPKKNKRWIKDQYFTTIKGDHWVFFVRLPKNEKFYLFRIEYVPIRRHEIIKTKANPYHPRDEVYFEGRADRQMVAHLKGKRKLRQLYQRQEGKCPVCQQKITLQSGWNVHHITPIYLGGTSELDNLVLLHPICHQQIHYQVEGVAATAAWKEYLKR